MTFEAILDECVDMMRAGASIDACVARFPEHADELRAQLGMVATIDGVRPQLQPVPSVAAGGRARLLAAVADKSQGGSQAPFAGLTAFFSAIRWRRLPQAIPAVLAMIVLGGAAWGVSAATGNPNPGTWLAGSDSNDVELEGTITAIDATSLTIATADGDVPVQLTADTEFEGKDEAGDEATLTILDFAVGDFVEVHAFQDESGNLIAREVELDTPDEADEQDEDIDNGDVDDVDEGDSDDVDEGDVDDVDECDVEDADEGDVDDVDEGEVEEDAELDDVDDIDGPEEPEPEDEDESSGGAEHDGDEDDEPEETGE